MILIINEYIEEVSLENFEAWVKMGLELWAHSTESRIRKSFEKIMNSNKEKAYIYRTDSEYIGFINVSLRNDYVEGTKSSPVGYVEGIFVSSSYRKKGIANKLLKKGEEWASRSLRQNYFQIVWVKNTSEAKLYFLFFK